MISELLDGYSITADWLSQFGYLKSNGEDHRLNAPQEQGLHRYVTRLNEVGAKEFEWGQISWLDSAELTGSETLTVGLVYIYPGKNNPEHYHPNCDETLFLLEGELIHTLGDEEYRLQAGDLIHIPQGVRHRATSVGVTPAKMIVSYNTGRREVVGEF